MKELRISLCSIFSDKQKPQRRELEGKGNVKNCSLFSMEEPIKKV